MEFGRKIVTSRPQKIGGKRHVIFRNYLKWPIFCCSIQYLTTSAFVYQPEMLHIEISAYNVDYIQKYFWYILAEAFKIKQVGEKMEPFQA